MSENGATFDSSTSRGKRQQLLVLTQYYQPEPNFITADVAEALAADWDVTVVTAHPNYPFGRFYKGARYWWPRRTIENGVCVWRLPLVPDHSNSQLRRFVSYLSFLWMALCVSPWVARAPAVVWVYQTPFTMGLAALWFKMRHRAKVIFTCADLWPESFTAAGVVRPGLLMRGLFWYSRWINRRADMIVCATRSTLERYRNDGISLERLHWLPVWVDGVPSLESAAPPPGERENERVATREQPAIVYAGNLGPSQHLTTLIEAAAILREQGSPVVVDLYGVGSAESELRGLAERRGADNVRFHGRVTPAEAYAVSAKSLAQVVSLKKTPLFRMTVPSKLYFCFAAGAPILAGLEGEAAELARESGAAFVYDVDQPRSLVAAIEAVLAMSNDARQACRANVRGFFHDRFAKHKLIDHYRTLVTASVRESGHLGAASRASFGNA